MATNKWDVSTRSGFLDCYRSTVGEVCAYAGLLAGAERNTAESVVRNVYVELSERARRGDATAVGFGYLRRAVRVAWVERLRSQPSISNAGAEHPVRLLSELSGGERTVMVLRMVDEMPVADVANELGTTERVVDALTERASRRLGHTGVANG